MKILCAFLLGGCFCLLWQGLFSLAGRKLPVPVFLAGGICIGTVLTATGVMEKLVAFGGGGMILQIINNGEALYGIWNAVLDGAPQACLSFLALLAFVFFFSVVFGILRGRRLCRERDRQKTE